MKHDRVLRGQVLLHMGVAPRAGAWIETSKNLSCMPRMTSPPARGRGLKPPALRPIHPVAGGKSPPARGRGLKPH